MSKKLVEIQGFKELQAQIKKLPDKVKRKELHKVLKQVAKPTVLQAQFEAPIRSFTKKAKTPPGTLKRSIGTIVGKKGRSRINAVVYVGPRAKGKFKGWYGHIVHNGRNIYQKGFKRKHKKGANSFGAKTRVKANPFMQRAYAKTGAGVTAEAEVQVTKYVQRQINRLSK